MTRDEFRTRVERARQEHPRWFDFTADQPLAAGDRQDLEKAVGAKLPDDYIWFLSEFGGGDFVFTVVYSADPSSSFHLPRKHEAVQIGGHIPFSDNGRLQIRLMVDCRAKDPYRGDALTLEFEVSGDGRFEEKLATAEDSDDWLGLVAGELPTLIEHARTLSPHELHLGQSLAW